jgi:hypothetical protein
VVCVGFRSGGLRLGAILVGGLPVFVSGAQVGVGEVVGQRFRGRLMFFSEPLVHEGHLIWVDFRTGDFRVPVVGGP